jgi:hypothetical protein
MSRRLAALLWLCACGGPETTAEVVPDAPETVRPWEAITDIAPGAASMRRLTRAQYTASIQAVFGEDLSVLQPTEEDFRVAGLATVGARVAQVTPAGFEGYEASARAVAVDVLTLPRRDAVVPCAPLDPAAADDACTRAYLEQVAPLLLRRALPAPELDAYVALAADATGTLGDFYGGLEAVTVALLVSPDFLFLQEATRPAVDGERGERLTGESLASRLSYFLWGRGPDVALLAAAAAGELDDDAGYRAQVDRLLADEVQLERGVRALFTDLYELHELPHVEKDRLLFPELTPGALEDAQEQTLRTLVDHLLVQGADYRDVFTTRRTFMTRALGPIYGVAVAEDWEAHTFPDDRARAGILSQVAFLALNARTSRSSPVLRGEFVLDKVLCRTIPPPPADVDFDTVAPDEANAPTARERLAAHRVDPNCSSCHDVLDPVGLAFENFDAIGRFRTHEDGHEILTYGDLDDVAYPDVRGFHKVLRNAPAVPRCLVRKLYMHGVGREPVPEERELLEALIVAFAEDGHALVPLMRTVALSYGFRATSGPAETEEGP